MVELALASRMAVLDRAEVCVIGGGLAGVAAALGTAAAGLDTVLVEERGALGWEVSHGLEIYLSGTALPRTLRGLVATLSEQNAARGDMLDPCALECLLDQVLVSANVRVHFRALCGAVDVRNRVARVITKFGVPLPDRANNRGAAQHPTRLRIRQPHAVGA